MMYSSDKPYAASNAKGLGRTYAADVELPQTAVRETPRLMQHIEHLEKVLSHCHHEAERIELAALRLIGPRPAGEPEHGEAHPTPESLEARLLQLVRYADALGSRLASSGSYLDSAI